MQKIDMETFLLQHNYKELSNLSCFGGVSLDAIKFLFSQCELFKVSSGETIFEVEEISDYFIIVLTGKCQFHKHHKNELSYIYEVVPGSDAGFVGMISLQRRKVKAVAKDESIILKVYSASFYELYESYNQDFVIFLMNITRNLARGFHRIDDLIHKDQESFE